MQYEIINNAESAACQKVSRSAVRVLVLSVMAGAFISLGGILSIYLGQGVPGIAAGNPAIARLLSGLAFPIGLFLIVLFGGELFTGNNAVLMPALARNRISVGNVVANWSLVWLGNFAGALLFTYFLVYAAGLVNAAPYHDAIIGVATTKCALPSLTIFLRGIGANWCVCLAVWLTLGSKTMGQKALSVWIPVAAFVILGFEHCIANMFFIPCGMMAGADITMAALGRNLLWSTLGNICGGALFVGVLYTRLYSKR